MPARSAVAVVGCLTALLSIAVTSSASAAPCDGFVDVDGADSAYCPAVTFMKDRGITLGCSDAAHYCPNDFVTRLQMALFMNRLATKATFLQGGNTFGSTAAIGTLDQQTVQLVAAGQRGLRIEPRPSGAARVIAGYVNNGAYDVDGATIAGGGMAGNSQHGNPCDYAYGCQNSVTDNFGTVGGGAGNIAGDTDGNFDNGAFGTVAGGFSNAATYYATVGGGAHNVATGDSSAVGGGAYNRASAPGAVVVGGSSNWAQGSHSTVAGGYANAAIGSYAFAAGAAARAAAPGEFVWADGHTGFLFDPSTIPGGWADATNTFNVRATGGVWFVTGINGFGTPTSAVYVGPGSGTWSSQSDRASKENFVDVDPADVLARVAAMPVKSWNYIAEGHRVRHLGPVSQDFREAFGLGHDDRHIATVDADGVALAAIKGLNDKLEAQRAANAALHARVQALEKLLARNAD